MNKYPKEWIAAVHEHIQRGFYTSPPSSIDILNSLNSVGALKLPDPPKEIWVCFECMSTFISKSLNPHTVFLKADKPISCAGQLILMREVRDESDE